MWMSLSSLPSSCEGQSADPRAPRTLNDGDRDGDPEAGQVWALQDACVHSVSGRAVQYSQHQAPGVWRVE